jgi:hypothetical protein
MKRGIAVFVGTAALMGLTYAVAGKWAIHHSTIATSCAATAT